MRAVCIHKIAFTYEKRGYAAYRVFRDRSAVLTIAVAVRRTFGYAFGTLNDVCDIAFIEPAFFIEIYKAVFVKWQVACRSH